MASVHTGSNLYKNKLYAYIHGNVKYYIIHMKYTNTVSSYIIYSIKWDHAT